MGSLDAGHLIRGINDKKAGKDTAESRAYSASVGGNLRTFHDAYKKEQKQTKAPTKPKNLSGQLAKRSGKMLMNKGGVATTKLLG